jgi:hypothetical protein
VTDSEEVRRLLEAVVMAVPCNVCGRDLEVTLGQVAGAHEALRERCVAAGESECPAMTYARLLDREVVESLAAARLRLVEHARRADGCVPLRPLQQG